MSQPVQLHDPDAVLDYIWDWTSWLVDGDIIDAHTIVVSPVGLDVDSSEHTDTAVTAWISGGDLGVQYSVTCRVTTVEGRTDDRTRIIAVYER